MRTCPECQGVMIPQGGCFICQDCGLSNCLRGRTKEVEKLKREKKDAK